MAKREVNLEKIKIVTNVIIIILLIILILQRSKIFEDTLKIGRKKQLNTGEMIISENGVVERTLDSSNWDTSKVTITKDADGKDVPVPKGYVGSSVSGENTINGGYVIYEGTEAVTSSNEASAKKTRNQWVWIPVNDPSRVYEEVNGVKKAKLYTYTSSGRSEYKNKNLEPAILPETDTLTNLSNGGLTGMTPDKLYQELQQEFDSTMESIEKYGGFYIGRYETGNLSQSIPVVRRMNTDIGNQTWYNMYSKMGYLAANENVKTNMIWGCLWDETLQWLVERQNRLYPDFLGTTSQWGNTIEATFAYTNSSGSVVTKSANQAVKIPTGSANYARALNIYDLCGNMCEYTLEGNGPLGRAFRGGCYATNSVQRPVAERMTRSDITKAEKNVCCRAYLYIK